MKRELNSIRLARKARFAVETLGDRVLPSAGVGVSVGATAHAAAMSGEAGPTGGATPSRQAARYLGAVDRLNERFQSLVDRLENQLTGRTAQFAAADSGSVGTTPSSGAGAPNTARTSATRDFNRFAAGFDRRMNRSFSNFNRRLDRTTALAARRDPAVRPANAAVRANFRNAEASIKGILAGQLRATRGMIQKLGASSTAGATVAVNPAAAVQAQIASDRAAVSGFRSQYDDGPNGFEALLADLATIPAAAPTTVGHAGHARIAARVTHPVRQANPSLQRVFLHGLTTRARTGLHHSGVASGTGVLIAGAGASVGTAGGITTGLGETAGLGAPSGFTIPATLVPPVIPTGTNGFGQTNLMTTGTTTGTGSIGFATAGFGLTGGSPGFGTVAMNTNPPGSAGNGTTGLGAMGMGGTGSSGIGIIT